MSSTLDGTQNLDILSGTGTVTITGNIGTSNALTSLDINKTGAGNTGSIVLAGNIGTDSAAGAGAVTLGHDGLTGSITFGSAGVAGDYNTTGDQVYEADSYVLRGTDPTFATVDDAVTFNDGDLTLATLADLTINTGSGTAGSITIQGDIAGTSDGTTTTVTLEAGSGAVAIKGMGTDIGNVTIDGSGGVTLNGSITTAGGNIDINNATTLATGAITLTTANGTVDFASTIDGAQNLIINSGTGTVDLNGVIGGGTGIGALTVNATSASHTGTGAITINEICLLYTSPSPRDGLLSRMPSSA